MPDKSQHFSPAVLNVLDGADIDLPPNLEVTPVFLQALHPYRREPFDNDQLRFRLCSQSSHVSRVRSRLLAGRTVPACPRIGRLSLRCLSNFQFTKNLPDRL